MSVGSLTEKTDPGRRPPAPPRAPVSWAPGTHRIPNRVHWVRIWHAIEFERPPRPGKSTFWRFWPVLGSGWGRKTSPDPLKPVNREWRPQEAEPSEVQNVQKLRNAIWLQSTWVQTRPKGNPNTTPVDCVHQPGRRILLGPFLVILGRFGPAWSPTWGTATRAHGALWGTEHGPLGSQR